MYLCLKLVFENATAGRNTGCRSVVNCALHSAASADCFGRGLRHPKCNQAMHLALPRSHCKPVLSSTPIHNNPVGLSLETWLANCGDHHIRSIAQGNDSSENFELHVKNEEKLRHVGNTYDFIYSEAHPPKVGAIPPAEI